MAWKIVVDGVADPREFKDSAEFTAALAEGARKKLYPAGADIRVTRCPAVRDPSEACAGTKVERSLNSAPPLLEMRPVFVYAKPLRHSQVMFAAVLLGICIGVVLPHLLP